MALQRSRPSNDALLRELSEGRAQFELVQPPAPRHFPSASSSRSLFFARIGSPMSPAMKKLEHYSVERVTGDGRCMFRALVKGMARNKGLRLSPQQEKDDADELRMAVKEIICDSESERLQYEEALVAITCEESLKRYCKRIERTDFWGGESELLIPGTDMMLGARACERRNAVLAVVWRHCGGGNNVMAHETTYERVRS